MARNEGALSKALTSSGVVTTAGKTGLLYGANLAVTTNDSSLIVENGGSGGTAVLTIKIEGSGVAGANSSKAVIFKKPIICPTDIYGTLAGTGATAEVYYEQIED